MELVWVLSDLLVRLCRHTFKVLCGSPRSHDQTPPPIRELGSDFSSGEERENKEGGRERETGTNLYPCTGWPAGTYSTSLWSSVRVSGCVWERVSESVFWMAHVKKKMDAATGRKLKMCPGREWGGGQTAAVFHSSLLLCGRMGAGALNICVSTNSPESSHSFTLFKCPEEFWKVDLCLTELCIYVTHACKFFQPRWGHLQPACFYSNCLKSALVSPHWTAVAPGLPSSCSSDHPHGDRGGGGGGRVGEDTCLGLLSSSSACGNRQEDLRACREEL